MEKLIQLLKDGHHSLVVENNGIHTYDGRGIADLYRLLHESPETLKGARVADKVVGKAAAALMILGGVKEFYAVVVSRKALALSDAYRVTVRFSATVEQVFNRTKTGLCPMESCCAECGTAEACLVEIERTMERLKSKQ